MTRLKDAALLSAPKPAYAVVDDSHVWPFIHVHSHFHLIAHDTIKRKDAAAPPAPKTSHAPGEDSHAVGIY